MREADGRWHGISFLRRSELLPPPRNRTAEVDCGHCDAICRYIDAPERNDRPGIGVDKLDSSALVGVRRKSPELTFGAGRRNPNRTKCHVAGGLIEREGG